MAALKEVRQRIKAALGIQQVTKAMKMVAAVKMRRAEARLLKTRPYAAGLEKIASHAAGEVGEAPEVQPDSAEAVVVIGSDGGLCGGFNVSLFRHVMGSFDFRNTIFFTVGRRARKFFLKQGAQVAGSYEKLEFPVSWGEMERIAAEIEAACSAIPLRAVKLAYQAYVSPGVSRITVEQWLPFSPESPPEENGRKTDEFRFEPGRKEVAEKVIARARTARFGRALLESQASEQGARMVAMDSATGNAGELQENLTKMAHRIRQWNITRELLEITTGVEARKN